MLLYLMEMDTRCNETLQRLQRVWSSDRAKKNSVNNKMDNNHISSFSEQYTYLSWLAWDENKGSYCFNPIPYLFPILSQNNEKHMKMYG